MVRKWWLDAWCVAAWMDRYNASIARTQREYKTLRREMLAEVGEGSYIRLLFHCDDGDNISLGKRVFLDFELRHPRCREGGDR